MELACWPHLHPTRTPPSPHTHTHPPHTHTRTPRILHQVLMTSPPTLLCFQLSQLLSFYHALVARILGASGQLSATLAACRDMATRVFFEQLRARGDKLRRNPPPPPKDLSPPPQVRVGGPSPPPPSLPPSYGPGLLLGFFLGGGVAATSLEPARPPASACLVVAVGFRGSPQ